jgi:hypothetical protein
MFVPLVLLVTIDRNLVFVKVSVTRKKILARETFNSLMVLDCGVLGDNL